MPSSKNQTLVEEISAKLATIESVVLVNFRGSSMKDQEAIRGKLREAGIEFRVIKNRLLLLSAKRAGITVLPSELDGQTAIAMGFDDLIAAPKMILKLIKLYPQLEVKGGFLPDEYLSAIQVSQLAKVPGRQELYGQVVGVMAGSLRSIVSVLSGNSRGLVQVLEAYRQKMASA